MFERFTERARQVVVLAQQEARDHKHSHIGTEHVLMGLLREEEGLANRVLNSLGVTEDGVREQIVRIVGSGDQVLTGQVPFTPRAKKVLELALREALSLGHNYIGTEHILLGLVRENEGVAARIMLDKGADSETVRNEVIRMLSGPGGRRQRAREESAGDAQRAALAVGGETKVEGPGPRGWTIRDDVTLTDEELLRMVADLMSQAGVIFAALRKRIEKDAREEDAREGDGGGEERAAG